MAQWKSHEQAMINGIKVDVAIAPLLKELWRSGLKTYSSCQEWRHGTALIEFYTPEDREAFKQTVQGLAVDVGGGYGGSVEFPSDEIPALTRGWAQHV